MPTSKTRKDAADKKTAKRKSQTAEVRTQKRDTMARLSGSRDWVPWVFLPVGLIGVIWLVVFYIAGSKIGFMASLGNWNFAISMGLIAASFMIATLWK